MRFALNRRELLTGCAIAAYGRSADWREFRGAGNSAIEKKSRLPLRWNSREGIAWSASTAGYGQSSPVVFGNRIFLTSIEGPMKETLHVYCLDLSTGRELWRRQFAATQKVKYGEMVSRAAPTPCVDAKRLYVFFESGDLMALRHDGSLQWVRKLTTEYGEFQGNHGIGSSPRLTSKGVAVLVAHGGPCYLLLVDRRTGRNIWKTERESKVAWTTPSIIRKKGQEQIVVSVNGRVESYDADSGESVWAVDGIKGNLLSSATAAGRFLIVGSAEKGHLAAIAMPTRRGEQASVAWRAPNASSYFGSPLIHRDRIWFAGKTGVGWCLEASTGRELWNTRLAAECWTSPVGVGDRVYFFTVKGVTQVFQADADAPEKIAENTIEDMERTYGFAIGGDSFVVRSGKRVLRIGA
jgi:outer membrane protein assembly factor BamB